MNSSLATLPARNEDTALYLVTPSAPADKRTARRAAKAARQQTDEGIIAQALAILAKSMRTTKGVFHAPIEVKQYCQLHLGALDHEVFGVLFLDVQNRLIEYENLFRGTLTQTSVYPREVVLRALHHQAAAVVLTHNHPSGTVQPSRADEALTMTLKTTLALVDVRVLDHVIVSASESLSMAERGLL